MAYEGEILDACGIVVVDFADAKIAAVSGDGPNVCGHLLIYSPAAGGYYFHVAGLRGYPRYMSDAGYRRYLQETGKRELRRLPMNLPNPTGANLEMERLLSEKWTWGVLPHNCVSFVESIISAGGGNWGSYTNCPALATADTIDASIQNLLNWAEKSVYSAYGVAR